MKPKCVEIWSLARGVAIVIWMHGLIILPTAFGKEFAGTAATTFGPWAAFIALVGAYFAFSQVLGAYVNNCHSEGSDYACWAGVVGAVTPSFSNGAADFLLPWNASHDRVDLVLKSQYWDTLQLAPHHPLPGPTSPQPSYSGSQEVSGVEREEQERSGNYSEQVNLPPPSPPEPALVSDDAKSLCNDDPLMSPFVSCYYFSSKVCGAGLGATIGAAAGGIAGIIAGTAVAVAITCATVFLCIIAMIVAFVVAVVCVIVGAFLGGQAGKALAPDNPALSGNEIQVGDYITVSGKVSGPDEKGNLQTLQNWSGYLIKIMFFVESTAIHGHCYFPAPYSYVYPDLYLVPDACPVPDDRQIK